MIDTVTTSWEFDRAGRTLVARQARTSYITRYAYDPAGNVIATTIPGKPAVTQMFDALNRLVERNVPEDVTPLDTNASVLFPRNGTQLQILADAQRFDYDTTTGGLRAATNRYALVRRTFYPNGQLKTDRLHIQPADLTAPDSTLHVYELGRGYDLNGRLVGLKHPASIAPAGADSARYVYDAIISALRRVTDPLGHVFEFNYDAAGQLETATQPNGITESFWYNGDGALRRRIETRPGYATLHSDSLTHTARGQIRTVNASVPGCCAEEASTLVYSGFGAVIGQWKTGGEHPVTEHQRYDAMGNLNLRQVHSGGVLTTRAFSYDTNSHRLLKIAMPPTGGFNLDSTGIAYDSAGSQRWNHWATYTDGAQHNPSTLSRTWYGPDGRAMVTQRYTLPPPSGPEPAEPSVYEEYRYDGLGRRVWVRSRPQCVTAQTPPPNQCFSFVQRTVWDGDQVLYEIRSPGSDSAPPSVLERDVGEDSLRPRLYGRVAYTHGLGIDRPLSLTRMDYEGGATVTVVPHQNWRGLFDSGTFPAVPGCLSIGSAIDCYPVDWPARIMSTFYEVPSPVGGPRSWFGTLIDEKRDGSGMLYMRNRYYAPKQGRFTQEDPIGLSGGLNLYGYADGDPVNYSDPFGLSPIGPWRLVLVGVRVGATGGATVGTVVPGVGNVAGGIIGGIAGGLIVAGAIWLATDHDDSDDAVGPGPTTGTNPDGSPKDPGQQLDEIGKAQQRGRKSGPEINRINKSKQRTRQDDAEEAERALEEARRQRNPPPSDPPKGNPPPSIPPET